MALAPKRTKYRKMMKGRMNGIAYRGSTLAFGEYGLATLDPAWLDARQIEAARVAITRHIKRGGKLWIRIFPDKPITRKPLETRMGKGKGTPEEWVVPVKRGRMLCEMKGVDRAIAIESLRLASYKLPVRTKIVEREVYREAR